MVQLENNKLNINQSYPLANNPLLSKSNNKVIVQEKILPVKYLPEKVNKVIIANNINTLPLIESRNNATYDNLDINNNFNNNLGMTNVNQNNPVSMSYQPQMINNNTINMSYQLPMTRNNQTFMSYQVPNYWK